MDDGISLDFFIQSMERINRDWNRILFLASGAVTDTASQSTGSVE